MSSTLSGSVTRLADSLASPERAEYLKETLGDRFAPPQILRDMVARGELGRKSGKGFYDYS